MKRATKPTPVFYDLEASCIGGLPIEIGWAFADLRTSEVHSESHLIKPPLHWDLTSVWDPDAQKLHRISRQQLIAGGQPPFVIAQRMNQVLAGRELLADAPADDERWLRIMFEEAGPEPTFTIRALDAVILIDRHAADLGWDSAGLEKAKAEAARHAPRKHRAEADARHLAQLWLMISRGPHHAGG